MELGVDSLPSPQRLSTRVRTMGDTLLPKIFRFRLPRCPFIYASPTPFILTPTYIDRSTVGNSTI